ncbi:probable glutathione S-transferase [Papaver somniferum]|uniref:probable glutathione S-transferase n=1 Tax=Papaver somniferum TaxID=3469 RepID=UPI000E6F7A39|nr:probable glutathione S-transferase [Papaver somniferum]
MEEESSVELLGASPSPFSERVIWGLQLKGIKYEYKKEDLKNKSEMLLKYNPVHKRTPVLVHGEKPISESMIILEYIEETWPESYPLLPKDPYEKSVARFWIKFIEDTAPNVVTLLVTTGEEQEKAQNEISEMLKTIEEKGGLGEKKFFGGDRIGMVDLAIAPVAYWLGAIEEVVGVKISEAHKFPKFHEWIESFKQVLLIKENLPNYHNLLDYLTGIKERAIAASP